MAQFHIRSKRVFEMKIGYRNYILVEGREKKKFAEFRGIYSAEYDCGCVGIGVND